LRHSTRPAPEPDVIGGLLEPARRIPRRVSPPSPFGEEVIREMSDSRRKPPAVGLGRIHETATQGGLRPPCRGVGKMPAAKRRLQGCSGGILETATQGGLRPPPWSSKMPAVCCRPASGSRIGALSLRHECPRCNCDCHRRGEVARPAVSDCRATWRTWHRDRDHGRAGQVHSIGA